MKRTKEKAKRYGIVEERLSQQLLEDCREVAAHPAAQEMMMAYVRRKDPEAGGMEVSAQRMARELAYLQIGTEPRKMCIGNGTYEWNGRSANVFTLYHNICKEFHIREEKFAVGEVEKEEPTETSVVKDAAKPTDGERLLEEFRGKERESAEAVDEMAKVTLPPSVVGDVKLFDFCSIGGKTPALEGIWYAGGYAYATTGLVSVRMRTQYGGRYEGMSQKRDGSIVCGGELGMPNFPSIYADGRFAGMGISIDPKTLQEMYAANKNREKGWRNVHDIGGRLYDCRLMKPVLRVLRKHGAFEMQADDRGVIRFRNRVYDILVCPVLKDSRTNVVYVHGARG